MKSRRFLYGTTWVFLLGSIGLQSKNEDIPRLPGAAVLIGVLPYALVAATPGAVWKVLPESDGPKAADGTPIWPSISRDGKLIACVRFKSTSPSRVAIATYSIPGKEWIEYAEADHVQAVSISPDKSRLAFISSDKARDYPRLHILDIRTGVSRVIPNVHVSFPVYGAPSWSPEGDRIVYQVDLSESGGSPCVIEIMEVSTGKTWRLGNGQTPAWSPLGESIAYLDFSGNFFQTTKCLVMRSDGTDGHVLYALPQGTSSRQRYFAGAPVWSPDSKDLLLNELEADSRYGDMRIDLLDLVTHKLTRKFKDSPPILGWAAWN